MYEVLEVGNLSYNNETKESQYLIKREGSRGKFNMPINMNRWAYVYPGTYKDLICQSSLDEIRTYTYTKEQLDDKFDELTDFLNRYYNDQIRTNGSTAPTMAGDKYVLSLKITPVEEEIGG